MRDSRSIFVTGTDTGVGKTVVAVALLHALSRHHRRVVGMKPVAAGLVRHGKAWVSEDAVALRDASTVAMPLDVVNPVALHSPISPHLAALHDGRTLTVAALHSMHQALQGMADVMVVEGSGGWRVPLNARETLADLAIAIAAPVVMVVGLRLGCLNHALLTAEAIRADGLHLAGWVANALDPHMACREENIATLRLRLGAPLLAVVPWQPRPDPRSITLELPAEWL
ncbi:MAG: bioD [Rhizobacter sp.]|nr:bioD [Rhizobacter sp.]